ncbi:hypothetical protein DXG01_007015 [Tephrocybe rancida]|nr:hypothetical protein DXG01_007015 [Tephrocybe rancida]
MIVQQKAGIVAQPEKFANDQLVEKVPLKVVLKPARFVKSLRVVYGDRASDMPSEHVRDLSGQNDDINLDMGGKYVWLVPEYTDKTSEALTRFDLIIQDQADPRYIDLAAGAGGQYRYLVPSKQDANKEMFITDLTLVRTSNDATQDLNAGKLVWNGVPQGHTGDINHGRKGSYLYLVWQLQQVGLCD